MSIPGKLVIAVAIGLLAAVVAALLTGSGAFDPVLAVLFVAATAGTALATHRPLAAPATHMRMLFIESVRFGRAASRPGRAQLARHLI